MTDVLYPALGLALMLGIWFGAPIAAAHIFPAKPLPADDDEPTGNWG